MNIDKAYDNWSNIYDSNPNKTRDLEAIAIRSTLEGMKFSQVIELGCGTGKNTIWLAERAEKVLGIDFSTGMLAKAREKIQSSNVTFRQADLNLPWEFRDAGTDLFTCSLVLEHIGNLDHIFSEARQSLRPGGLFYICELHPFKQYSGSKAKYEEGEDWVELTVFVHNISEFTTAAKRNGFRLRELNEWWDEDNREGIPRLVSFLFEKEN